MKESQSDHAHCRGSIGLSISLKRRREGLDLAVLPLDDKLVLEHDEVTLTRSVGALLLKPGAESVKEVAARGHLGGGEEAELAHLGKKEGTLGLERGEALEGLDDGAATSEPQGQPVLKEAAIC